MSAQEMTEDRHEVVEGRLRRVDQRYTLGRRAIVDVLVHAGQPLNIADISARLPELPRSSAYRHLVDLQTAGVVRRVAANDEFARFELAEDLTEPHPRLLCVGCGTALDISPSAAFERTVTRHLETLADAQ